jgi:Outer membrane protein beta-barrel domain
MHIRYAPKHLFSMKKLLLLTTCFVFTLVAHAQFRTGVTIGVNIAHFDGPSATDATEQFSNLTGFFIGPSFTYRFTDHFGLRGELLYSKRGSRYKYTGPMYRTFTLDNNQGTRYTTGTGTQTLDVNNTYFDVPVMALGRFGDLEITGGIYASLLAQTVGDGSMQYSWRDGSEDRSLEFNLRHNYYRDSPGEASNDAATVEAILGNRKATLPKTLGAYYDETVDNGNLYKTLDYGALAGISYFVSRSLYLGVRLQYGLSDLTRNAADRVKSAPDANQTPVYSSDFDRNFNIQAKVGFSF